MKGYISIMNGYISMITCNVDSNPSPIPLYVGTVGFLSQTSNEKQNISINW
jgi:hypothetical protein